MSVVYTDHGSRIGVSMRVSQLRRSETMKKSPQNGPLADRPDPDSSRGVRGEYFNRLAGLNFTVIAPDLHETFPTSEAVNQALRNLKQAANRKAKPAPQSE